MLITLNTAGDFRTQLNVFVLLDYRCAERETACSLGVELSRVKFNSKCMKQIQGKLILV